MMTITAEPFDLGGEPGLHIKVEAPDSLWKILGGRAAAIRLGNSTNLTWTLGSNELDHTVWTIAPASNLGPKQGMDLGAQSSWPALRGTKGKMIWYSHFNGQDVEAVLNWDAPHNNLFGSQIRSYAFICKRGTQQVVGGIRVETALSTAVTDSSLVMGYFSIIYGPAKPRPVPHGNAGKRERVIKKQW